MKCTVIIAILVAVTDVLLPENVGRFRFLLLNFLVLIVIFRLNQTFHRNPEHVIHIHHSRLLDSCIPKKSFTRRYLFKKARKMVDKNLKLNEMKILKEITLLKD